MLLGETTDIHTYTWAEWREKKQRCERHAVRAICALGLIMHSHSSSSGSGDAMQNTDCAKALMSVSATKHGGKQNVERNKKWAIERIDPMKPRAKCQRRRYANRIHDEDERQNQLVFLSLSMIGFVPARVAGTRPPIQNARSRRAHSPLCAAPACSTVAVDEDEEDDDSEADDRARPPVPPRALASATSDTENDDEVEDEEEEEEEEEGVAGFCAAAPAAAASAVSSGRSCCEWCV
jgi:hypothetical protein